MVFASLYKLPVKGIPFVLSIVCCKSHVFLLCHDFILSCRFLKKIEDILDSDIGVQTPRALPTDPLLGAAR